MKIEQILLFVMTVAASLVPFSASARDQSVCLECHELLTGPGSLSVKPWRTSIHAEYGISCHDCHGGDPRDFANAMEKERGFLDLPKEAEIPSFCGRCHVGIMEDYLQSAHGKTTGPKRPTCVTCHGSHDVKKATLDLINEKSCSRCHPYERSADIKAAMEETEGLIAHSDRRIRQVKSMGIDTEIIEKGLFSTRNSYRRLFHSVDVARVMAESGRMRGELEKIASSLERIEETLQKRKIAGAAAVGVALLAALLCYILRKSYD